MAAIYGVIVYTNRHVHVRRMLDDDAYWQGLDEIVGARWVVFSSRTEWPVARPVLNSDSYPLVPVPQSLSENRMLFEAFGIASQKELPVLAVYAERAPNDVLSTLVPIASQSETAAYESLSHAFEIIGESIEFMWDSNRRRKGRAFDVVESKIRFELQWRTLRRAVSFLQWLRSHI